jgi:hypothetical protein
MSRGLRIAGSLVGGAVAGGIALVSIYELEGLSEPYDVGGAANKACITSLGQQSIAHCPSNFNGYPVDKPHQQVTASDKHNAPTDISVPTQEGYTQYIHERYEDHVDPGVDSIIADGVIGALTSIVIYRRTSRLQN